MMRITESYNSHLGHLNIPSKVCLCASLLIIQKYLINRVVDQKYSQNLQRKKIKLLSGLGVTALAIGLHTYFGPKITCITLGGMAFAATIFKFCNKPKVQAHTPEVRAHTLLDSLRSKERATLFKVIDTKNKELGHSFFGNIVHASHKGLVISNGRGLFASSDGWNWKQKCEGMLVQTAEELIDGSIAYQQRFGNSNLYSFKLDDDAFSEEIQVPKEISDGSKTYNLKNIIAWLTNSVKPICVDSSGIILSYNKENKQNPYSFLMKVEATHPVKKPFLNWDISNVVLCHRYICVVFICTKDNGKWFFQLKLYDREEKNEIFCSKSKNETYDFVGDHLIISNKFDKHDLFFNQIKIHDMGWWPHSWLEHEEKAFKIRVLNESWVILECYEMSEQRPHYSHLKIINVATKENTRWDCSAPKFAHVVKNLLIYGDNTLNILNLEKNYAIKDIILPDFHTVLDVKILSDELLILYSNSQHLQRLIKLDLNNRNGVIDLGDENSLPPVQLLN